MPGGKTPKGRDRKSFEKLLSEEKKRWVALKELLEKVDLSKKEKIIKQIQLQEEKLKALAVLQETKSLRSENLEEKIRRISILKGIVLERKELLLNLREDQEIEAEIKAIENELKSDSSAVSAEVLQAPQDPRLTAVTSQSQSRKKPQLKGLKLPGIGLLARFSYFRKKGANIPGFDSEADTGENIRVFNMSEDVSREDGPIAVATPTQLREEPVQAPSITPSVTFFIKRVHTKKGTLNTRQALRKDLKDMFQKHATKPDCKETIHIRRDHSATQKNFFFEAMAEGTSAGVTRGRFIAKIVQPKLRKTKGRMKVKIFLSTDYCNDESFIRAFVNFIAEHKIEGPQVTWKGFGNIQENLFEAALRHVEIKRAPDNSVPTAVAAVVPTPEPTPVSTPPRVPDDGIIVPEIVVTPPDEDSVPKAPEDEDNFSVGSLKSADEMELIPEDLDAIISGPEELSEFDGPFERDLKLPNVPPGFSDKSDETALTKENINRLSGAAPPGLPLDVPLVDHDELPESMPVSPMPDGPEFGQAQEDTRDLNQEPKTKRVTFAPGVTKIRRRKTLDAEALQKPSDDNPESTLRAEPGIPIPNPSVVTASSTSQGMPTLKSIPKPKKSASKNAKIFVLFLQESRAFEAIESRYKAAVKNNKERQSQEFVKKTEAQRERLRKLKAIPGKITENDKKALSIIQQKRLLLEQQLQDFEMRHKFDGFLAENKAVLSTLPINAPLLEKMKAIKRKMLDPSGEEGFKGFYDILYDDKAKMHIREATLKNLQNDRKNLVKEIKDFQKQLGVEEENIRRFMYALSQVRDDFGKVDRLFKKGLLAYDTVILSEDDKSPIQALIKEIEGKKAELLESLGALNAAIKGGDLKKNKDTLAKIQQEVLALKNKVENFEIQLKIERDKRKGKLFKKPSKYEDIPLDDPAFPATTHPVSQVTDWFSRVVSSAPNIIRTLTGGKKTDDVHKSKVDADSKTTTIKTKTTHFADGNHFNNRLKAIRDRWSTVAKDAGEKRNNRPEKPDARQVESSKVKGVKVSPHGIPTTDFSDIPFLDPNQSGKKQKKKVTFALEYEQIPPQETRPDIAGISKSQPPSEDPAPSEGRQAFLRAVEVEQKQWAEIEKSYKFSSLTFEEKKKVSNLVAAVHKSCDTFKTQPDLNLDDGLQALEKLKADRQTLVGSIKIWKNEGSSQELDRLARAFANNSPMLGDDKPGTGYFELADITKPVASQADSDVSDAPNETIDDSFDREAAKTRRLLSLANLEDDTDSDNEQDTLRGSDLRKRFSTIQESFSKIKDAVYPEEDASKSQVVPPLAFTKNTTKNGLAAQSDTAVEDPDDWEAFSKKPRFFAKTAPEAFGNVLNETQAATKKYEKISSATKKYSKKQSAAQKKKDHARERVLAMHKDLAFEKPTKDNPRQFTIKKDGEPIVTVEQHKKTKSDPADRDSLSVSAKQQDPDKQVCDVMLHDMWLAKRKDKDKSVLIEGCDHDLSLALRFYMGCIVRGLEPSLPPSTLGLLEKRENLTLQAIYKELTAQKQPYSDAVKRLEKAQAKMPGLTAAARTKIKEERQNALEAKNRIKTILVAKKNELFAYVQVETRHDLPKVALAIRPLGFVPLKSETLQSSTEPNEDRENVLKPEAMPSYRGEAPQTYR